METRRGRSLPVCGGTPACKISHARRTYPRVFDLALSRRGVLADGGGGASGGEPFPLRSSSLSRAGLRGRSPDDPFAPPASNAFLDRLMRPCPSISITL